MKRFRTLTPVACVLISIVSGAVAAPRVRPIQLMAYDANSRRVGEVVQLIGSDGALVSLEVEGIPVVVNMFTHTLSGLGVYYDSSDCTGTPHIAQDPIGIFRTGEIVGPGWTLFVSAPNAVATTITVLGQRVANEAECLPNNFEATVMPAVAIGDLRDVFTPPFRLGTKKEPIWIGDLERVPPRGKGD